MKQETKTTKVMISTGYGAGFGSWNEGTNIERDIELIKLVEEDKWDKAIELAKEKYPNAYLGGFDKEEIIIREIDEGDLYRIDEDDGFESIDILSKSEGWKGA